MTLIPVKEDGTPWTDADPPLTVKEQFALLKKIANGDKMTEPQITPPAPNNPGAGISPTPQLALAKAKTPSKKAEEDEGDEPRELTDLEISIAKFEKKFSELKHVEAQAGIMQYVFPLLRALAAGQGDVAEVVEEHEQEIDDLHTAFDAGALGVDGDEQVNALNVAFEMMVKLGTLLDEAMVTAGFYTVNKDGGLEPTKKVPRNLHTKYMANISEVRQAIAIMQVAMRAKQVEDEREAALDELEDELDRAKAALDSASTDEEKTEAQAKITTLEAQIAAFNAQDEDEGEGEGEPGESKDGE